MAKGLSVDIYRSGPDSDSTNGGVTGKAKGAILVDPDIDEIFESDENHPALKINKRFLFGRDYLSAEPLEDKAGLIGPMFGGNFIYTSDSRFPSDYPIPVHDRYETQEQYDHLSV